MRRLLSRISGAALLLALALAHNAYASVNGNIAGVVTDEANGKALAGVTVTVTGPALQGEQTEFTDSSGRYIITELPPGEYTVRAYFSNIKAERVGIFLNADKTLQVNFAMPTQKAATQTYRITERAPTVDVGNTQVQTQVTSEFVKNTPVQGRDFQSVLTLAPGSAVELGTGARPGDKGGFSFGGATGPENNFLIDGLNTTNPAFGLIGTSLSLEFIGETEIITGGYNAEYGRATGGVVNVITKSGSNQFHGDAWFYYTPFQLNPEEITRLGESIGRKSKVNNAFDFGFDIGGPILKDRIWFYAGFNPQFETDQSLRILHARTANNYDPMATGGSYLGDIDPSFKCPGYLTGGSSGDFCKQLVNPATGPFATKLIPGAPIDYPSTIRKYQWIAKLNFNINENNSLEIHYIGTPQTFDGASTNFNSGEDHFRFKQDDQVHDVGLHFVSKLLDRKLQIDIIAGYHYEYQSTSPSTPGGSGADVLDARTVSLAAFEPNLADCALQMLPNGQSFNPCRVSNYQYGGNGFENDLTNQRISAGAGITYFLRLAGTHALKAGFDFEDNIYKDHRYYTSGAEWQVRTSGSLRLYREFGTVVTDPATMMETVKALGDCTNTNSPNCGFSAQTTTLNEGLYLRDSWNVGFVPGLTINAGLRWEFEQVKDINGTTVVGINDNIAPRVGFIYDFTRKGQSKIFASYGRFFESIPLDINDRQFSGEGLLIKSGIPQMGACKTTDAMGNPQKIDPTACDAGTFSRSALNGGTFGTVSPVLKGMYSNEVVAGIQYDVGLDLVLGASYIHRDLGRIIEDMSPDGGVNYIIANPGDETDQGTVRDLQGKINNISNQIKNTTDPMQLASLQKQKADSVNQLALYQSVSSFDKPQRDYNALVITATKRLSHNFIVLASYTYSRTLGNYPGLFQSSNGQLDPNISSQYDLKELLVNRYGPLPNDRPHNLKINGAYNIPIGAGGITIGAAFNVFSGTPIEVLGQHPFYGRDETFILPRGSGGRTPTVTQLDLHIAYGRQFSKLLRLDIYWDTFNVANTHTVTAVDEEYTVDDVLPVVNGTAKDLYNLKNTSGTQVHVAPNYGQPIAFQAPLSMRFGIRVSF